MFFFLPIFIDRDRTYYPCSPMTLRESLIVIPICCLPVLISVFAGLYIGDYFNHNKRQRDHYQELFNVAAQKRDLKSMESNLDSIVKYRELYNKERYNE